MAGRGGNPAGLSGNFSGAQVAYDEMGQPFISLRDQGKQSRIRGLEAHKANIIAARAVANIRQAITKAEEEVGALTEEARQLGQAIRSKIKEISECRNGKIPALGTEADGLIAQLTVIQEQTIPAKIAEIAALESQLAALSPSAA